MKWRIKAIVLLMVVMLMGMVLTGCNDRDTENTNSPTETNQPHGQTGNQPQRQTPPLNPNAPPIRNPDGSPIRNPDGTVG